MNKLTLLKQGSLAFQIPADRYQKEGTIVRIRPEGKRTWRYNSEEPLLFMVIQSKQRSLEYYETAEGIGVRERAKRDSA